MDINKKYYLQLRDVLGSEYVLGTMSDEEVILRLLEMVGTVREFEREIDDLKDSVSVLESEVRMLEAENDYLRQEYE